MDAVKIKKQIKLEGKSTDFNWFNQQYQKGRLQISGFTINASVFETLRIAIRATNDVYDKDWDMDFIITKSGNSLKVSITGIILRFPEVVIRNSRVEHTIKELFVRIPLYINNNVLKVNSLEGGRMQQTYPEWSTGYFHSHLRRNIISDPIMQPPFYDVFCTGSGHINDFMANINGDGVSETRFTSLLLQIMSMVSWESIEGVPYVYIKDIFIRNHGSSRRGYIYNTSTAIQLKEKTIVYHKTNNILPRINYELVGDNYKILNDDAFETFLKTSPFNEAERKKYLCYSDEHGSYYRYGDETQITNNPPQIRKTYLFRTEELKFEVTDTPTTPQQDNREYKIHPAIKEFIIKDLEYDTNIKKIRKSTIDRYES
jgi:hypothetical protein